MLLPRELIEAVLLFLPPCSLARVENASMRMRTIVARAACRLLAAAVAPASCPLAACRLLTAESWACIARFAAQLRRARAKRHQPFIVAAGTMVSGCYCLARWVGSSGTAGSSSGSSLLSWGHGGWGRLGHGDTQRKARPTPVRALCGQDVVAVAAHAGYAAAVTAEGWLLTWGDAVGGRLGHEGLLHGQLWVPRRVRQECMDRQRVISVACGGSHALALCEGEGEGEGGCGSRGAQRHEAGAGAGGRQLWAWGSNAGGTLGLGLREDELAIVSTPRAVPAFAHPGIELVQIAAGVSCSAALSGCGTVFTWGMGTHGRLGHGLSERFPSGGGTVSFTCYSVPKRVEVLAAAGIRIVCVAAGSYHMLAVSDMGKLWAWGGGHYGQLGLGGQENQPLPLPVAFNASGGGGNIGDGGSGQECSSATNADGDSDEGEGDGEVAVVSVAAGAEHSAALDATGALWTWGSAADGGQLGHGDWQCQLRPKRCAALEHERITHVSCAQAGHSIALSSSGQLWTWGGGLGGLLEVLGPVDTDSMLPTIVQVDKFL